MSFEKANEILKEIEAAHPENADALEQFRIKYLGTKGVIKDLFGAMKNIAAEQRKDYGQLMNTLKVAA